MIGEVMELLAGVSTVIAFFHSGAADARKEGEGTVEILASVIKDQLSIESLPQETPAAIRRLLPRCLEKNPKRRLRDIGEARVVIEDVLAGSVDEQLVATAPHQSTHSWLLRVSTWLAAALLITALVFAWCTFVKRRRSSVWCEQTSRSRQRLRLTVSPAAAPCAESGQWIIRCRRYSRRFGHRLDRLIKVDAIPSPIAVPVTWQILLRHQRRSRGLYLVYFASGAYTGCSRQSARPVGYGLKRERGQDSTVLTGDGVAL